MNDSFCCSWYCRACLLDPGLIYFQVNNFPFLEIKGGKDPLRASHFVKPCERTCFVQLFLCLIKMTQMEGPHMLL